MAFFVGQSHLYGKIYLFLCLFFPLVYALKEFEGHKTSLSDPDLHPLAGFLYRPEDSLPLVNNITFIYYANESFVMLGFNDGLIEFNLNQSKSTFKLSFDRVFTQQRMKLQKPYAGFKLQNSDNFYFCLDYEKSKIAPLFVYKKGIVHENEIDAKNVHQSWPQNYCTTNSGDNLLLITSSSNQQQNSMSVVEIWKNGITRIRKFQKGRKGPIQYKYNLKREPLKLVGGFMRRNVAFFMSRERHSAHKVSDARAYVNVISKVCEPKKDSNSSGFEPNLNVQTAFMTCTFQKVSTPHSIMSALAKSEY